MSHRLNRRDFLATAAAGAAATTFFGSARAQDGVPPSEQITVGVMGLSRGLGLCGTFGAQPGVRLKYICDVDSERLANGLGKIEKSSEQRPEGVDDFRRILDDPEVDVLVCAAPNHWHAPASILACSAGKHVYVEKPCSHNAQEGELLVEASRKYNRAVQMGSQRRSSPGYVAAIQALRERAIGRVYLARSWYNNLRDSIGTGAPAEVPSRLNYELWQGPAPRMPYIDNRVHYNWHWFWHWGNGELGNNGVHALDICRWGLGVDYPVKVTSAGGRYRFADDQETPDTHSVAYEFEGGQMATWEGLSCNKHRVSSGFVAFFGEEGTLEIDGGGNFKIFDKDDKVVREEQSGYQDADHVANLLAAIRSDKPRELNAEILEGHKSTLLCHLGNIAQRVGRTLHCDAKDGRIRDDKEAMQLWGRDYESGWEPVV